MKLKTIEFDNSKQSISDLIDEIANSIKESFDKSKSDIFKYMIADTKMFVDWAKDYNEVDNLLHQNIIIIALNNLKKVSREELELLDADEIDNYYNIVKDIEIILSKYSYYICKQVKDNIKDIVNKRMNVNKSSYKPTKEDLNKLRKEDLINMIINEEEPKKNQN